MRQLNMGPFLTDLILSLWALVLAMQGCRIIMALKVGKRYRLRWLVLSVVSFSLLCPGALLMPTSPAVVFLSAVGALKTAFSFLLLAGGLRLLPSVSEAMKALPKGDLG